MSELGAVVGSLGSMSQLQLLLAFVTCAAYALAIGNLLLPRGRRLAWLAAAAAAVGFGFESDDWTRAAMLVGFAIAGLAAFAALAWFMSRLIRVDTPAGARAEAAESVDSSSFDTAPATFAESPRARPQPTGPAHFV